MKSFIICGYGIPEDIFTDKNYPTYLNIVFNRIYSEAKNQPALLIPCGGRTSCTSPYTEIESAKLEEYLRFLMDRAIVADAVGKWNILLEDQSLSSLENFLFAKKIIAEHSDIDEVIIFCEQSRLKRNEETVTRLFPQKKVEVVGIDFDISQNRYLPDDIVAKKEKAELEHVLWALQSEENMQKHHAFFEEKFKKLRAWQEEGMSHVDAVTRWYKEGVALFEAQQK